MRIDERRIHQLFEIGIILKGVHALVECVGGVLLYFVSTRAITRWVDLVTRPELQVDPRDYIATHLAAAVHHLTAGTVSFYAFYLLGHGLINMALVIGLLRTKLWAYPASLLAIMAFIAYQIYRYSYTQSFGLILLTLFDLVVVALIWHEWRIVRRHFAARMLDAHSS